MLPLHGRDLLSIGDATYNLIVGVSEDIEEDDNFFEPEEDNIVEEESTDPSKDQSAFTLSSRQCCQYTTLESSRSM